jgi:uroporphyrinogen-III synthase
VTALVAGSRGHDPSTGSSLSVLVTRPAGRSDALAAGLRAAGLTVHLVPTVATEPIETARAALAAVLAGGAATGPDWLVVTSPVGAAIAVEALRLAGLAPGNGPAGRPGLRLPRLAAVGRATAAVLAAAGWAVDVVPADARGAGIAAALGVADDLRSRRVVLARADAAGSDLPDALRAAGAVVDDRATYRTIEGPPDAAASLGTALRDPGLAAIVFASGSAVRGLVRLAADEPADLARLRDVALVAIGPTTAEAIRSAGFEVAAIAARPDDDALLDAVLSIPSLAARRQPS